MYVYKTLYTITSNICNTWVSALPDMYAQCPRASVDISGNACMNICVTNGCYTSGT